ncbi:UNVERIFIED_CONTAM: hypothetical protein Slati_2108100 [Sesamum latifolium]|uniref:Uncharacterized protein n=1 Tax=Sesamum latifolium TaxID=2727402 RepID=A0AAW2WPD4_9LAMI
MNRDQRMVYDAIRPYFFLAHPNPEPVGACSSFRTNVHAVDQLLYNDYDESQLSVVAQLVNIKAENNMSERCYNQVFQWTSDLLPRDHTLCSDYYNTKKLIRDLGLPIEKIHACKNGCMFYWKDDMGLEYCNFCGDPRYKPTRNRNPQSKKSLYAIPRQMRVLCDILMMLRRRVILTLYNLPPEMCMKSEYMFLTMVIPGPSNSKYCIDIYLELLIEELLQLWYIEYRGYYGVPCLYGRHIGRKAYYFDCHRQFLSHDHLYKRNKRSFTKNQQERKIERLRLTVDEIRYRVEQYGSTVEEPLTYTPGYGNVHK